MTLLLLVSNLLAAANPLLLRQLPSFPLLAPLLILFLTISSYLKYKVRKTLNRLSTVEEEQLKEKLFTKLQHQKDAFFQEHPPGALLNVYTSDLGNYRDLLYFGLFAPINLITLSIPSLAISFVLSWQLALLSLLPMIGIPLIMMFALKSVEERTTHLQKKVDHWNIFVLELIKKIRNLKHPETQKKALKEAEKLSYQIGTETFPLRLLESSFFPLVNVILRGSTLLFAISALLLTKFEIFPLLDFLSFLWIQGNLLAPVLFVGWSLPLFYKGQASWDRIQSILHTHQEKLNPYPTTDGLSIRNLSFHYPKLNVPILDDVNIRLEKGHLGVLAGPLGSGKTTLFRLLLQRYPVESGSIQIENPIAYVEQSPFLFTGTIRENIALSKPNASDEEIEKVIFEAGLEREIASFSDGIDTSIGERGITLSGGQKKRLALARAFLSNRPLLIVDDPFSALDAATAKRIGDSLKAKAGTTTVLVATNHVPFFFLAQQLYYLSQGKIVQSGGQELLIQEGPYYHLRRLHETLHR